MLRLLLKKVGLAGATFAVSAFCTIFSLLVTVVVYRTFRLPNINFMLFIAAVCPISLATPIAYSLLRLLADIENERKELQKTKQMLEVSLSQVKELSGLLPICASCKKIRDDRGYWNQLEAYISEHSKAVFSHGICPDCIEKLYPES